jgi:hypothetical protein
LVSENENKPLKIFLPEHSESTDGAGRREPHRDKLLKLVLVNLGKVPALSPHPVERLLQQVHHRGVVRLQVTRRVEKREEYSSQLNLHLKKHEWNN